MSGIIDASKTRKYLKGVLVEKESLHSGFGELSSNNLLSKARICGRVKPNFSGVHQRSLYFPSSSWMKNSEGQKCLCCMFKKSNAYLSYTLKYWSLDPVMHCMELIVWLIQTFYLVMANSAHPRDRSNSYHTMAR